MKYTELENKEGKVPKDGISEYINVHYCLIVVFIISLCSLVLTIFSYYYSLNADDNFSQPRKETVVDKIVKQIIGTSLDFALPTRFVVDNSYILPPSNQQSRGTCWIFSTLMLMESHYRHQGIKAGYLNPDEYVSFSKQAYGAFIGQNCIASNFSVAPCKHGGLPKNTTDDHKADSIYYFAESFPGLKKSLLPESVCEYIPKPDPKTDFECPGMEKAIPQNPIEFKIKGIKYASDVYHAKKLIVSSQRPLVVGNPLGQYLYYAPCNSSGWGEHDLCTKESVPCPAGYKEDKCALVSLPGRAPDGTFLYIDDYSRSARWGGHAMNVVGYNDDWIYHSRHTTLKSLAPIKGGFIYHNSWASRGHSVEYLLGRRSEENEAVVCPNHEISTNWIPTTLECIKKNAGDHTKCGKEFSRVRGFGITKHADLLKCIDPKLCDTNKNYVLSQSNGTHQMDVNSKPLFSGLDKVEFITWTKDDDMKTEFFDLYPFHYLHAAFKPVDNELVKNNELMCGYYIMPYAAIEMMNRKTWSNLDNFHVADIDVEYTPASYASQASTQFNYTLLKQSTKKFQKVEFDGPLPYDKVY